MDPTAIAWGCCSLQRFGGAEQLHPSKCTPLKKHPLFVSKKCPPCSVPLSIAIHSGRGFPFGGGFIPPSARAPSPSPGPPFWLPVPLSVAVCRRIGSPKVGSGYFLVITLLAACTWTRVDWERQRQGPPIGACRHQPRTRHTWEGRLKESKVAPVGSHGTDCGCGRVSPKQMVQPALVTEPFLCHWKAEPALAATPSGPMPP